ncbi:hypothetical protein [Patulibacter minatonensis]|uniref:hypothetical protein n=1 Tax=Patulibacter minatonensis TaxID=298163 RepID=UPI00047A93CB|nr:hypothetical protein [Patulibacter minatonensis]
MRSRAIASDQPIDPPTRREYEQAAVAWKRYLALRPTRPDAGLADGMARAFGSDALDRPDDVTTAYEVALRAKARAAASGGPAVTGLEWSDLYEMQVGSTRSSRVLATTARMAIAATPAADRGLIRARMRAARRPDDPRAQAALRREMRRRATAGARRAREEERRDAGNRSQADADRGPGATITLPDDRP